jgi:hypothetical protein
MNPKRNTMQRNIYILVILQGVKPKLRIVATKARSSYLFKPVRLHSARAQRIPTSTRYDATEWKARYSVFATMVWRCKIGTALWLAASLALAAEAKEARSTSWEKIAGGREPGKPILAVVELRQQKITVYDSEGPILQAPVSSGRRGYETPAGVFTLLQKNKDHVSNLYDDSEMPFMQRLTWSGVALHAGPLPGYRASHGCIRLPYGFAERLFDLTSVGTRVIISPGKTELIRMSHPLLHRLQRASSAATPAEAIVEARRMAEKVKEEADAVAQRAEQAAVASRRAEAAKLRAVKQLSVAIKGAESQKTAPRIARAQARLEKARAEASSKIAAALEATKRQQSTDAERKAAEQLARDTRLKAWPLSILVSRKAQRVYVRHGFEPVLELPAVIREPGRPMGTHAFYAVESEGAGRAWIAASFSEKGSGASQALDRIEMLDEVAALMQTGAWLGSTVIVSDEPPYKETGPGTDFIVVLSTEPQGALKIRAPDEARPVAAMSRPAQQQVRGYRTANDDRQFRHPLGGFAN